MSESKLLQIFSQHTDELRAASERAENFHKQCIAVAQQMFQAFAAGNKILVAGNGGSAAEAQHFSDEMLGRYRDDRRPYPAVALTTDGAALTCIGNDYGFDQVFSRQVEALGLEGDIFIGLTTSGTSKNILLAAEKAREVGMTVIAMSGEKGELKDMADYAITSPSHKASVVQEYHLHALHLICEAFETPELISESLA